MDDLDLLETALASASPVDLNSSALQSVQELLTISEEPPHLHIDEVIATLDSLMPPNTTKEPSIVTLNKLRTPPQSPSKEISTSPAETRINDALSNLLRSTSQPPSKRDIFAALESTLMKECSEESTPKVLMQTMIDPIPHSVALRDRRLQARYDRLQGQYPTEITQLSSFHRHHAAVIEADRYMMLHLHANSSESTQQMYHAYFDSMLHNMMERVENSLSKLEEKSNTPKKKPAKPSLFKGRTQLTKKAISMMEEWYQSNLSDPYPCQKVVQSLAVFGEIREEQVRKWFANKRTRHGRTTKIKKFKLLSD